MYKFGFIGFGQAGSHLIKGLLRTGALYPSEIIVSTRTIEKALELEKEFPGIEIAASNLLAAEKAERLVVCVHSQDFPAVLDDLKPALKPNRVLITLTDHFSVASLESLIPNPVVKLGLTGPQAPFTRLISGVRTSEQERRYLSRVIGHLGPLQHHCEGDPEPGPN